jgi:(S)-2-hydroxy-acid oxidase
LDQNNILPKLITILFHRSLTIDLVKRAEKNGFKALVLTVDASVFGKRYADVKNNFQLPPHLR